MRESLITAVLAGLSLCLVGAAGAGIVTADRKAPVISLDGKNNLTYTEGEPYDVLLENMTAEDDKDGDVTESLRVSNIYVTEDNRAVVLYVAKDEANNIGKLKREIRYKEKKQPVVEKAVEEKAEEEETAAKTPETETTGNETVEAAAVTEETTQAPQTQQTENTAQATGKPQITMILNAATLKVGETFNVLRYVQEAVDTDGTSLNRYIHADGAYDMSQPGTYNIRVYATSPSGSISNIETFTLTVEP